MILQIGNILSKISGSKSFQESLNIKFIEIFGEKNSISISDKKNKILRITEILITLLYYNKKVKMAILHSFSTQAFYITLLSSFICNILNIKYITLLHGGDFPKRIKKSPKLISYVLKRSKKNISPSKYLQFHFQQAGFEIEYIPNAVEIENFQFLKRIYFKPRLLWVRSFAEIYNPEMAVKVVSLLKVQYPEIKLTMVGGFKDSSHERTLKLINELNLNNNIKITGVLSHNEWAEISKSHDIFINTTTIDNMPLSVLQAMSLGLPVFSTDVGGISWLIEDGKTGVKCENNNPEDMSDKINFYLNNHQKLLSIANKANLMVNEFSWKKILPKWLKIIQECENYESR